MALTEAALAALISGGAALAGTGINAAATSIRNRKQLGYQKELAAYTNEMNLENWKLQNEYNSPKAQMQRYKEAGLNPNLIYGQGTSGNAGALPGYDTPRVDLETPRFDLASVADNALTTYYDARVKEAQIKGMEASASKARVDSLLSMSRSISQNISNALRTKTFDYSVEAASLAVQRESQNLINDMKRGALLDQQVEHAKNVIEQDKVYYQKLVAEKTEAQVKADLWENGINPNDPLLVRIASDLIGDVKSGFKSFLEAFKAAAYWIIDQHKAVQAANRGELKPMDNGDIQTGPFGNYQSY